jgi:ATP/maltotriose-dependent transcriptional regulator MalT
MLGAAWGLALAACGLGDYQTAREHMKTALEYAHPIRAWGFVTWYLPVAAVILAYEGEVERAAELLGLAFTYPASATAWMEQWPLLTRLRADLEAELGAEAYQITWERGTALDLETVVTDWLAASAD